MKKIGGIILAFLAATIVAAILFYQIRKNKSVDQYVYQDSHAIIAIAVDDFLIDHLSQFLKSGKGDSTSRGKPNVWKDLWDAGVHIPAHIYLFNLTEDPTNFYSIHAISHPQKWKKFLSKYSPDSTAVADQQRDSLPIRINAFISIWSKDDQLYIRLNCDGKLDEHAFPEDILNQQRWVKVKEMPTFDKGLINDHLNYWTCDGDLQLHAAIASENTSLTGSWKVNDQATHPSYIRQVAAENLALVFQSTVASINQNIVKTIVDRFSEEQAVNLLGAKADYVDIHVSSQLIAQKDTIITYDYDENFNTVEKTAIQEVSVPFIESVWKGKPGLGRQLPDKLFYKFHKADQDSLVLLSTKDSPALASVMFLPSDTVLHAVADFKHWPDSWTVGPLKALQQQAVKATVAITKDETPYRQISGHISHPKIAL